MKKLFKYICLLIISTTATISLCSGEDNTTQITEANAKNYFKIDSYETLGLYFFSLKEVGILITWNANSLVKKLNPESEKIKKFPDGTAYFKDPRFNKEEREFFYVGLFMVADAQTAKKEAGKYTTANGRFLITPNKYSQIYVDAFKMLLPDKAGNLYAPLIKKKYQAVEIDSLFGITITWKEDK